MLTTFFALVFMFAMNPALLPNAFKPQSPIVYRGSSKPAVVPNFLLKGPAAVTDTVVVSPDSTCIITIEPSRADSLQTRADSLQTGLVDPSTFTRDEFEDQLIKATEKSFRREQFLDEVNGRSTDPFPWT